VLEQAIRVVLGEARGLLSVQVGGKLQDLVAPRDNGLGCALVPADQCLQRRMR
jgi:hypothetical protein